MRSRFRVNHATVIAYLALFVALGGTTYAATGGNFILGQSNSASSTTSLSAPVAGKALQATNNSTAAGATALGLNVASGHAPFAVNSGTKVANLNADKLDGLDSGAFVQSGCQPTVPGTGAMVKVGSFCIDKYEASVWSSPTGGTQLTTDTQIDAACPNSGQPSGTADCVDFFARSVAGVTPAETITWFQAQQALANSGKRLPSNADWQAAVSSTPDDTGPGTTPCNTRSGDAQNTGANAGCVSRYGTFDMVGNVWEWVADWGQRSSCNGSWGFSDDRQSICGATTSGEPGAPVRGGSFFDGASAGPFAVSGFTAPSDEDFLVGFRGAR